MRAGITVAGIILSGWSALATAGVVDLSALLFNPGFEAATSLPFTDTVDGLVQRWGNVIPNWSADGDTGVLMPRATPTGQGTITPAEGLQVAFSNGGVIRQYLPLVADPFGSYRLTYAVGRRFDMGPNVYTVALYIGGSPIGMSIGDTGDLVPGTWRRETVYADNSGYSGQIEVVFANLDLEGTHAQINFDTAVSEPSTIALVVCGAALAMGRRAQLNRPKRSSSGAH